MKLVQARVTDSMLQNLVLENPLRRELLVGEYSAVQNLLISSQKHKYFGFLKWKGLVQVKMDAPSITKLWKNANFFISYIIISICNLFFFLKIV